MSSNIVTVVYGGKWKVAETGLLFDGNTTSKAFVLEDTITLLTLRDKDCSRFNVDESVELEFSHLHPFKTLRAPLKVDSDADLKEFLLLSKLDGVNFSVELCVTNTLPLDIVGHEFQFTAETVELPETDERYSTNLDIIENVSIFYENQDVPQDDMDADRFSYSSNAENSESFSYNSNDGYWNERYEMMNRKGSTVDERGAGSSITDSIVNRVTQCPRVMYVGKTFESRQAVKDALYIMSMIDIFGFEVKKSTPKYYRATCIDRNCDWKLHTKRISAICHEVILYRDIHTCTWDTRARHSMHAPSNVIAGLIQSSGYTPKQIIDKMRTNHKISITYWKAWKSARIAQVREKGSPESNFAALPSYCHILMEKNPGTVALIKTDSDERFEYLFLSYGQSIRAFPILKKVVVVDGTFLTREYKGTLLGAVIQDANIKLYPLAIGIVDTENNASWEWFFQQLSKVIQPTDDLVFVSDRHSSISKAIKKIYPNATHCVCMWHLKQNIQATFKKRHLADMFQQAAETYTVGDFAHQFDRIKEECPSLATYLISAGLERWARAHAKGNRYNMMTSNNAESLNSVLSGKKILPIVALLEFFRDKFTEWSQDRRKSAALNTQRVAPAIMKMIQELQKDVDAYTAKHLSESVFEVTGEGTRTVVDLSAKQCTCRVFDIQKIPCIHALSAIVSIRLDVADFVAGFYTNEAWILAHAETIYPVLPNDEINLPEYIKQIKCYPPPPPNVRKRCGRPPQKRKLSKGEFVRRAKYSKEWLQREHGKNSKAQHQ